MKKNVSRDKDVTSFLRSLLIDAIPAFSIVGLIIVSSLPLGLPSYLRLGSLLPLMGISYWSLVRPATMKMPLVFTLGLVSDCLLFSPLGLHAFVLVLSQAVLMTQRRFLVGQGFWVLWAGFALVVTGAYFLQWCLFSLLNLTTLPLFKPLFGAALSWAVLPLLAALLNMLHGAIEVFDEPV